MTFPHCFSLPKEWWLVCCFAILPSHASAQNQKSYTRWALDDGIALLREGTPRAPLFILGGVAFLAAGSRADDYVRDEVREGYTGGFADYLDVANEFGNPLAVVPVTGIFAVSLLTPNRRFQDAAFTSLESWFYATGITTGIKIFLGRHRPETGSGSRHFSPFSGNDSFPSGHTTAIFAVITPWVMYFPNVATFSLFALGTSTAIARVARNKHWPTDVIAGAAVGVLTARFLSRRHLHAASGTNLSVVPVLAPGASGLYLTLNLN